MMKFEDFRTQASKILGLDLASYKPKRVERRVLSLMRRQDIDDYPQCLQLLKTDMEFRAAFLNHFTINTSEFFRNPQNFTTLEEKILPDLFKEKGKVNIWSAPCSNGCEPYSIAILLDEMHLKSHQYKLLGIDLDPEILKAAKKGVYNQGSLKNVSPQRLEKYFTKGDKDHYTIKPQIKNMVNFKEFDLLKDTYEKDWDLILCRNLFIYLNQDIKDTLTNKFVAALRPGGILFLGNTEFIFDPEKFGLKKVVSSFYMKK